MPKILSANRSKVLIDGEPMEGLQDISFVTDRPTTDIAAIDAANRIGASVVPINPDLRAAELEYMIGHSEPALIISIPGRIDDLRAAVAASGLEAAVIAVHDEIPAPRSDAVVATLTPDGEAREAAVLYTSGTTGQPKGCVLSNRYFLGMGDWYRDLGGIVSLTDEGERMITPLPVFHMNAQSSSSSGEPQTCAGSRTSVLPV